MRTLTSILMAGLLLPQALTGVCCHRPCDCAAVDSALVEHHSRPKSSCCHHRASEEREQAPASAPCKGNHCLGFCTYVLASKVQLDNAWQYTVVDALDTSAVSIHVPAIGAFKPGESAFHIAEPPLRLHLLHQIIVI